MHGKLNKIKFCSIQCYISPLGSLPAISINVLKHMATHSYEFARFIHVPVPIPIVPNGKYPHREVVICPTLLD